MRTDADYVWVLDPIDGTKAYITGLPIFGTLIALLHRGQPVLGIIDQPILKERWLGVVGRTLDLQRPADPGARLPGARSRLHVFDGADHVPRRLRETRTRR